MPRDGALRFGSDSVTLLNTNSSMKITSISVPPIAGVIQGTMVLDDAMLQDMTLAQLTLVLAPKISGSTNLDRILGNVPLNFRIFMSSLASATGNLGQANYTAANAFIVGLASARRHRGLAASVIDIGAILGVGIVTRDLGDDVAWSLANNGQRPVSERTVHAMLAEAVRASDPTSGVAPWHIASVLEKRGPEGERPHWYALPQFARFTTRAAAVGQISWLVKTAATSIQERLLVASTCDNIIVETLLIQMRKMLHLGDDYVIEPSLLTIEPGLDSLVDVRIRKWILQNFHLSVPALRIMKGMSMQRLFDDVREGIPQELTPALESH
ncbi:hypothetical protein VHEMI08263 [[Torrubiella] hemipterigena]|uniref:Ketoreductase domain-containing protein n=1 Tax=[Torrubiella] hemipterigena TaxID=1531966 RepID=A0A0A1TMW3_9HYPO|nr:hypothetical protein VHEMI08263 [[Torrubiella] hemipterigena]